MEIILSPIALEDLKYWKQKHNDKMVQRIKEMIEAIKIDPCHGIGKPELLKHKYSGMWSRRLNREHRIVYKIEAGDIIIQSLKDHY